LSPPSTQRRDERLPDFFFLTFSEKASSCAGSLFSFIPLWRLVMEVCRMDILSLDPFSVFFSHPYKCIASSSSFFGKISPLPPRCILSENNADIASMCTPPLSPSLYDTLFSLQEPLKVSRLALRTKRISSDEFFVLCLCSDAHSNDLFLQPSHP